MVVMTFTFVRLSKRNPPLPGFDISIVFCKYEQFNEEVEMMHNEFGKVGKDYPGFNAKFPYFIAKKLQSIFQRCILKTNGASWILFCKEEFCMRMKRKTNRGNNVRTLCALAVFSCMVCMIGCSTQALAASDPPAAMNASSMSNDVKPEFIEPVLSAGWRVTEHSSQALGISKPGGIDCSDGKIYLCSTSEQQVVVLDRDFQIEETIGSAGRGAGEFSSPTDLVVDNGKMYVLDSGNNRLQVLNLDGTPVSSSRLLNFSASKKEKYAHLALLSPDEIVFSVQDLSKDAGVYQMDNQKDIESLTDMFWGPVYACNGTIYAINQYEFTEVSAERTNAESGENSLLIFEDGTLKSKIKLPYMYSVSDFVVADDQLYLLSSLWNRLDHFDLQGNYIETIAQFPFEQGKTVGFNSHLAWDAPNNTFYITAENSALIYEVQKQPE